MSQQTTIPSTPSTSSLRRGRLLAALVALLLVGIGAGLVAYASTDSSSGPTIAEPPGAAKVTPPTCSGDGGYLLAVVAVMPADVSARVAEQLSPETRELMTEAAFDSAAGSSAPAVPDPATLAGVLSRVPHDDALAVTRGLPPETRVLLTEGAAAAAGAASQGIDVGSTGVCG